MTGDGMSGASLVLAGLWTWAVIVFLAGFIVGLAAGDGLKSLFAPVPKEWTPPGWDGEQQ